MKRSIYLSEKWQEMKSLNARLVCSGQESRRTMGASVKPRVIEHRMTMDDAPKVGRRYMTQQEAARRYELREEAKEGTYGRNVFRDCQVQRPGKGKYRNTASREEAGTIARVTMGVRTGKYSVCVCSVKQLR